jgi:hypothetical protein
MGATESRDGMPDYKPTKRELLEEEKEEWKMPSRDGHW